MNRLTLLLLLPAVFLISSCIDLDDDINDWHERTSILSNKTEVANMTSVEYSWRLAKYVSYRVEAYVFPMTVAQTKFLGYIPAASTYGSAISDDYFEPPYNSDYGSYNVLVSSDMHGAIHGTDQSIFIHNGYKIDDTGKVANSGFVAGTFDRYSEDREFDHGVSLGGEDNAYVVIGICIEDDDTPNLYDECEYRGFNVKFY